jgi:MFS family permease
MPWKALNPEILAREITRRASLARRPGRAGQGQAQLWPPTSVASNETREVPPAHDGLARALDVTVIFLQWAFAHAVFHRGYVLASGLYLVIVAHLAASQLLVLGTVMSVTLLVSDLPTGVWSDAVSRKWPLVAGHMFLAAGMTMTGLVTSFPLLVITQALIGLGWGLSSGADVAWITDELSQPDRIDRVLAARSRWNALGSATGLLVFGLLAWAVGIAAAVVTAGAAMGALGLLVAARFTENNFTPAPGRLWQASSAIFQRGIDLARRDRQIMLMLIATMLLNGASMVALLFPLQLVDLGFPGNPVLWYTAIGVVSFTASAVALRVVETRIAGPGAACRFYVVACGVGALGLIMLAYTGGAVLGSVGVVLATGVSFTVTRTVSVIWVNRRTTSDARATVHSFLSQAECAGEIISGIALAGLARAVGIAGVLTIAAVVIVAASVIITRARGPVAPNQNRRTEGTWKT